MNLLKQIEASLKGINQARFQDLVNHLLHVKGYTFIGAPGSVVAKEKTSKGVPDSFFILGDKYVFVECTTQEKLGGAKSFIEKLLKDVEHCFNVQATKIAKEEIEQIILACNEEITPSDLKQLKEKIGEYSSNANLEVYDIQNLPMHIYGFPGLSEQYLGVTIVKGEIYNLSDFLLKTEKGLQPSLTNQFIGREEELKKSIELIHSTDILLLSGASGVGKSKLAVAVLEEVSKTGFIPIVIQSSAVPLWDDFVNLFQNGRDYIILFDDANKSVQNLTYLLDFIQKPKTYRLKVVITSRDYVKQQILQRLNNSRFREVTVGNFKDKEIEEIILKVLPNLQHHLEIKNKIIELSKGNARVALMATYSVTPDSEMNYLSNPVTLYEKYFEKISEEIEAFSKSINLQALAIVSFFGVLNRENTEIRTILENEFGIDWDELWSAILHLHSHEILDIHSNEVVKVSDQVLATFAFYKCFLDNTTAVINYEKWLSVFISSHAGRIRNSIVDINNTFNYHHVKELVQPYLQKFLAKQLNDEQLYSFFSIFWFYKGYDTLLYLQKWITSLTPEPENTSLEFTYVHNNHTTPSKHFELLTNFWNHPDELLKPSINMCLQLVEIQPSRLPECLKFLNDHFSYKWADVSYGYLRQNTLLDTLLSPNSNLTQQAIANGMFLNIIERLLGWHFTEYGPSKGMSFTIYNFDLHNSPELTALRCKMLDGFYSTFDDNNEQCRKVLHKLMWPGGNIDNAVLLAEIHIYEKLIVNKLSTLQYGHCKFVRKLAKKIFADTAEYPLSWLPFINAEILNLSKFLKTDWKDRREKTIDQLQEEKQEEFKRFFSEMNWPEIEKFLYSIDNFYKQQSNSSLWEIEAAVTDIFIAIANKGKPEIKNALEMFFAGKLSISLQTRIIYHILNNNILTAKEFSEMIHKYEFVGRPFWTTTLLNAMPREQADTEFLQLLIETFKNATSPLPVLRMKDYIKFGNPFEVLKNQNLELSNSNHNIISYLTEILLNKVESHKVSFGWEFCQSCAEYFTNKIDLLRRAFIYLKQNEQHFDYDGKEFEAVLALDSNFLIHYLEQGDVTFDYLSFKFEDFKLDKIWALPEYERIINKAIDIIISKVPYFSNYAHAVTTLFTLKEPDESLLQKVYSFISKFIRANISNKQHILVIMNVVLHQFPGQFIKYLREILLLNTDVGYLKSMFLTKGGAYSGSRVPHIQHEIDFCKEITEMIKGLPNVLNYAEHIHYIEQKVEWLKKDIQEEQRREFLEHFE